MAAGAPRVTLFLPGLFTLPLREATEALLAGAHLPVLGRALARGAITPLPQRDYEAALFGLFGLPVAGERSPGAAAATASLDGVDPGGGVLRADPVHLRADATKAVLFGPEAFSIEVDEARLLCRDLAPLVDAHGARLVPAAAGRWYLTGGNLPPLEAASLSRVRGADVRRHLPGGAHGTFWRRLLNEVQMTLHEHSVNRLREQRGDPAVNSVWFWGGGGPYASPSHDWTTVWGTDPLLRALAGPAAREEQPGSGDLGPGRHLVAVDAAWTAACYGDVEAWRAALAAIEETWLAPLWRALRAGRIRGLTLHTEGHALTLGRREAGRWWRRRAPLVGAAPWEPLER